MTGPAAEASHAVAMRVRRRAARRVLATAIAVAAAPTLGPRNAQAFEIDEHRQLWDLAMAPMPVELRERLRDPIRLQVFTTARGGSPSRIPVPFRAATRIVTRELTIAGMTQLPDLSYALWDWASGNETCPIDGPGAASSLGAADCHDYATHLGPLNSSHFLPQAEAAYERYHAAAVAKAYQCADVRSRLAGAPAPLAAYARDCDIEAFVFEAVAHHFLHDAFSTGHMWYRWGGPNPDDFSVGVLFSRDQVAVAVAGITGLIHGARAVLQDRLPSIQWFDPLSAPIDVARFPVDGVANPVMYLNGRGADRAYRPGVGDLFLGVMQSDYRWQYDQILDCARASIHEVATAARLPSANVSTLSETRSDSFRVRCLRNLATNESMLLGFALDGIDRGMHVRLPLDDAGGGLVIGTLATLGVPLVTAADSARLGRDLLVIGNTIRNEVTRDQFGTNLAEGGLPPLLGARPNDAYLRDPPSRYSDPPLPLPLAFDDPAAGIEPAKVIGRAFHRAHARDWCQVATVGDLEALRGAAGAELDAEAAATRCQVCVEIAGRHLRIGENATDYDVTKEPLCAYLADNAAYVYADVATADPLEATVRWCGCASVRDGGTDGPPVGPGTGGSGGSGGGSGGSSAGTAGGGANNGGGANTGAAGSSDPAGGGGNGTGAAAGNGTGGGQGGSSGSGGGTGTAGTSGSAGARGWQDDEVFRCPVNDETCGIIDRTPPNPFDWFVPPVGPITGDPRSRWEKLWDAIAGWLGGLWGDPHLVTLDGLMIDFQAVGEFVLTDDRAGFLLQVRLGRWRGTSDRVSGVTAIAARVGAHRVGFYADSATPVRVDGSPVAASGELALTGGGSISFLDGAFLVRWPGGEEMHLRAVATHLDVILRMPRSAGRRFIGLMGDGDGVSDNDIAMRDGTVLAQPVGRSDLYGRYGESWRLAQEESLFDYPAGLGTADFTDRALPAKVASSGLLSASEHAEGMKMCMQYGVVMPTMINACVLDYALSKDPAVIRAYQGTPAPVAVNPAVDYHNDFERIEPDGAWSPITTGEVPAPAQLGPNRFAGPFTDESVSFILPNLPAHSVVTVSFDLYVMGGWSGEEWSMVGDGQQVLMSATFDNVGGPQSYPDFRGVAQHPARTGASSVDALTASNSGIPDAVYHHRYIVAHSASRLGLAFVGPVSSADPSARWGIDNVEVLLAPPADMAFSTVNGITILHGPAGPPAIVGCADGRREAFVEPARHPNIAGCMAGWSGTKDLRAAATGVACGDGIGLCGAAADACAPGWRLCGMTGDPADLRSSVSADQCALAGGGTYLTAMGHCNGSSECLYADDPGETYQCKWMGWCSEPVCCGNHCIGLGACPGGIWAGQTRISDNLTRTACGLTSPPSPGGVLCCRAP